MLTCLEPYPQSGRNGLYIIVHVHVPLRRVTALLLLLVTVSHSPVVSASAAAQVVRGSARLGVRDQVAQVQLPHLLVPLVHRLDSRLSALYVQSETFCFTTYRELAG